MKKKELKNLLDRKNIPDMYYSLEGGLFEERICIDFVNNKWIVYEVERGQKLAIKEHDNENKACKDFLGRIFFLVELIEKKKRK